MVEQIVQQEPFPGPSNVHDAAATTLAAGGFLAAFGVASCCALPVALGALGLGSTFLFSVAALVGPFQLYALAAAAACLAGAGWMMWRRRQAAACGVGASCPRPAMRLVGVVAIVGTVGLLALTFWIEPPI